jgi:hypothetical protein
MAITPLDGLHKGYAAVSGSDKLGRTARVKAASCSFDSWEWDLGDLFDDPSSCWYTEFDYWKSTIPDGTGTVAAAATFPHGFDQFYYFGKKVTKWNGFLGFRSDVVREITDWLAVNPVTDALRIQWWYTLNPIEASTDNYTNTMQAGHPFLQLAWMAQRLLGRKIDWYTERCAAADKATFDTLQSDLVYTDDLTWYRAVTVGMLTGYNQMGAVDWITAGGPNNGDFGTCI